MLACTRLTEESVEGIITSTDGFVAGHLAVRLDTVLEAEELPTSVPNLDTTLAEMKAEDFTHGCKGGEERRLKGRCSKSTESERAERRVM